jgi:hypothetical protein
MVLALGVGALGGWVGGRAEHWDIVRRMVTIDSFLRGFNARAGKVENALAKTAPLPLNNGGYGMTEADIWREAEARGMLHSQIRHRAGE